jgi:diacylglycerol kinase family enzyme
MDQKQKWVFIINPVAGNGFGLSQADKIKEMINKYDLDAEVVYTERRGHASELSKKYAQNGYKYIIAVGDGTFELPLLWFLIKMSLLVRYLVEQRMELTK